MDRAEASPIPRFTLDGVPPGTDTSTHYFSTGDGLGLSMLRFCQPDRPPVRSVLVIHGLTTSTDMFIMPEHTNLVTYLLERDCDVWCIDFRMSMRHSYNLFRHRYSVDHPALYDFPPALEVMRAHGVREPIHVVSHCMGALAFLMSLFAGKVWGVTSVVANSAGLILRVPGWSRVKLSVAPAIVEYVLNFPYLNPRWAEDPAFGPAELFARIVSALHPECDVAACHMLSLMWGSGRPALYCHENLAEETHRRAGDLFGATSVHYYRHVSRMVRARRAVKFDPADPELSALPDDYLDCAGEVSTPLLLLTGDRNNVFGASNIAFHRHLSRVRPGRHQLRVLPGYGHQDPFMGRRSHLDVFPHLVAFMEQVERRS